ncbi:hypothetical protein HXX76_015827 [Chlamydomonas incerta]|uniref:Uncharacterized protein n=1 Tax=Chlamydomonas incerta TaxID=51695 RepID=A0A835VRG5_CHLIN|nr:hypothetical protein HXX76_015827 [Chlamydomonas incerta]|eukprot:KAG2422741.1 hypothetical protein HXX76_015827 [Chlamydomonas incerta]
MHMPPPVPGWTFYHNLDSHGSDCVDPGADRSPPSLEKVERLARLADEHEAVAFNTGAPACKTFEELAATASSLPGAVAFNTTGCIMRDVHSQSNWQHCLGLSASSWAGLYVQEEVVAARGMLRPLPGGGLDPRLRYFQRAKTRLLAARDVHVVGLNGLHMERIPDPDHSRNQQAGEQEEGHPSQGQPAPPPPQPQSPQSPQQQQPQLPQQLVRLRSVCWLQLDASFYGLGPGRYEVLWVMRKERLEPVTDVNFTITLSATRPHRPLEVFRSTAAADDEGREGAEGGGGGGRDAAAACTATAQGGARSNVTHKPQQAEDKPLKAQPEQAVAGPGVGSVLSSKANVRLDLQSAGEFEAPAGAIYDIGVRLWNFDGQRKSDLLFKELRLVRL